MNGKELSPMARWILAIVMAVGLNICIFMFFWFGVLAMGFSGGSYNCHVPEEMFGVFIYVPPILMALGALTGGLLFGLKKRWFWWLGAIIAGGGLGIAGYILWFILLSQVWCG